MAKRINPTFNTYQERILNGRSENDGLEPASIVKVIVGEWIKNLSDKDRKYYLELCEEINNTKE